jgi:hypothetical protein
MDLTRPGVPPVPAPGGITARTTRVDASGVWVTPLGDDHRDQVWGPCRGIVPPAESVVLLIQTQERPWVVAYEELT